jgi:hypothetical protein
MNGWIATQFYFYPFIFNPSHSYTQNFDLEGESGIVVRAIGTAVNISKMPEPHSQHSPAASAGMSPGAFRE